MTLNEIRKNLKSGKRYVVNTEELTRLTCDDSKILDCGRIASAVYKHAVGSGLYVCWYDKNNKPTDLKPIPGFEQGYVSSSQGLLIDR